MLLTAIFTVFVGLLTAALAWIAYKAAEDARAASHELRAAKGAIVANSASCEALLSQIQKLRGQFFAFKSAIEDGAYPERAPEPEVPRFAAPFCDNYGKAQLEGPMSPAARCDCGYCTEMRARRDASREELIPKTAAGQAAHARKASGQGE